MKHINVYIFCSRMQIFELLNVFHNKHKCNYYILCWHKTNATPAYNHTYLSDTEYILYFYERGYNLLNPPDYDHAKTCFFSSTNKAEKGKWRHPTIKPQTILRKLIENSSKEGDIVLDTFMGSGSTAIACKSIKRKFVGFEINKQYYEMSQRRLKEFTQQQTLF